MIETVECPFCHEKDYDLEGLKYHLENYCEIYAITKNIYHPKIHSNYALDDIPFDYQNDQDKG